jgi:hypothetical protein
LHRDNSAAPRAVKPMFAATDLRRQKAILLATLVLLASRCVT